MHFVLWKRKRYKLNKLELENKLWKSGKDPVTDNKNKSAGLDQPRFFKQLKKWASRLRFFALLIAGFKSSINNP